MSIWAKGREAAKAIEGEYDEIKRMMINDKFERVEVKHPKDPEMKFSGKGLSEG